MRVQFATLGKSPEVVLNALRHVPMDELHLFTDDFEAPEVVEIEKQLFIISKRRIERGAIGL